MPRQFVQQFFVTNVDNTDNDDVTNELRALQCIDRHVFVAQLEAEEGGERQCREKYGERSMRDGVGHIDTHRNCIR